MFEYLEIWHYRHRRHSALGWLSPIEFKTQNKIVAGSKDSRIRLHRTAAPQESTRLGAVPWTCTTSRDVTPSGGGGCSASGDTVVT
jgi:hypothetical protein